VRWAGTRTLRCRKLEASSDEEVLLDVDGEQPGRLPASFELLPGALRIQV
jgi:diacylglycerol kinase family enzyme